MNKPISRPSNEYHVKGWSAGDLLKLYGGLYSEDGDYLCFADGLAVFIDQHNEITLPDHLGSGYLEVFYEGQISYCLVECA